MRENEVYLASGERTSEPSTLDYSQRGCSALYPRAMAGNLQMGSVSLIQLLYLRRASNPPTLGRPVSRHCGTWTWTWTWIIWIMVYLSWYRGCRYPLGVLPRRDHSGFGISFHMECAGLNGW